MLSRILSIILCLILCAWGIWSIHAGFNSDQGGPIFGGFIFLIVGLIIISIIVWDTLEQIMNKKPEVLTQNFFNPEAYRLAQWVTKNPEKNHPIAVENAWEYIRKWDGLEQIVNNTSGPVLTDCDQERTYREDFILYDEADALNWRELNTPDPNLIHPDDAKRERTLRDADAALQVRAAELGGLYDKKV